MPSSQPLDTALYNRVRQKAKSKFKVWPSAYASAWLVREYKKQGGRYGGSSKSVHKQSKTLKRSKMSKSVKKSKRKLSRSKKSSYKNQRPLKRWFAEQWIDVCQLPRIVPCGRQKGKSKSSTKNYPYCRPLKRISSKTPRTARELSTSELKRRCACKHRNPMKKVY